ncbi:MAG: hypothetical protein IT287_07875 [Bdellovibrionaceae bacterium]|nr:hypothetical protein [Pseudobdellovibrionaceae bacterium]
MAKIAVLCSNHSLLGNTGHKTGVSLYEVSRIAYELEKADHRVDFISPSGGAIPIDPTTVDFSDPISRDYYERQTFLQRLNDSPALESVVNTDYSAVIIAGGWGCIEEYWNNLEIGKTLTQLKYKHLVFAGYGAYLLLQPELIKKYKGLRLTVSSPKEDEDIGFKTFWPQVTSQKLQDAGYETVFSAPWSRHIIDSGEVLSAQNVFSAQAVCELLVNKLKTEAQ